ncbi:hypothetical protein TIFTF001_022251 [Ficus carica]|uniref:LOB domain-containing protein n=1 Tax=Ficus carica TaxID=3494 RepID=A0AA88ALR1_FICCA|nr:hypothetical protein TIFTF001_022251 [Ficus carica]
MLGKKRVKPGSITDPVLSAKAKKKRCSQACKMAPFFPRSKTNEFRCANRLFGSSNIRTMIGSVKPSEMQTCADSIIIEGRARMLEPVRGCYGLVRLFKAEVDAAERELAAIKRLLALCKMRNNDQATAAATMAQQMILRGGGLHIPAPPVPESPAMSLPPSMPGGPAEVDHQLQQNHQGVHQMLAGLRFPRAVEMFMNRNTEGQDGYVYQSTKKEGAGYLTTYDLQMLDQMVDGSIKVNGNWIVADQNVGGGHRGSSSKGKEVIEIDDDDDDDDDDDEVEEVVDVEDED